MPCALLHGPSCFLLTSILFKLTALLLISRIGRSLGRSTDIKITNFTILLVPDFSGKTEQSEQHLVSKYNGQARTGGGLYVPHTQQCVPDRIKDIHQQNNMISALFTEKKRFLLIIHTCIYIYII